MNAPLRYLSVCSGIEAATVAWYPLGWVPVGFAEIEAFPSRVLAHHYGSNMPGAPLSGNGVPNFGDFTAIDTASLGPVDLLVGGTPCQAFSVAGKRLSLADARGNLSLAYTVLAHELARSHGLRWAVWENVPGVLSTDDNAFGCFLGALVGGDDPVEPVARPKHGRSNAFWRWRKAGTEVDDDGNELAVSEGHVTRWPRAGMVAGPLGRAAWRVLDAQYFGLAQRRRRVFVVGGLGAGTDPAAVLFEPQGLRRDPTSRREAGAGVAASLTGSLGRRGGQPDGGDTEGHLIAGTLEATAGASRGAGTPVSMLAAYGGNNTAGPIDVATTVNAHGGPHGRQDFESETFVTHALRADGFDVSEDGTGRGTPLVPIAFDTTQITHPENRCAAGHAPAIAFDCKAGGDTGFSIGDLPGALRGAGHGGGHAAIAFQGRGTNLDLGQDVSGTLGTGCDRASAGAPCIASAWAVRRLMPVETERLQGFPDGYTSILGAADGPRYKTHGNSMAVPVMAWIGRRIAAVDAAQLLEAAE